MTTRKVARTEVVSRRLIEAERDGEPTEFERPAKYADCEPGGWNEARPCPFVGCLYNTFLDVRESGSITKNFGDIGPEEVPPEHSCVLDLAKRGPHTLNEVGTVLCVSRERVRQLEEKAIEHGRKRVYKDENGDIKMKVALPVVRARIRWFGGEGDD